MALVQPLAQGRNPHVASNAIKDQAPPNTVKASQSALASDTVQNNNRLSVHDSDKARHRNYVWPLTQNNIGQNVVLESDLVCGLQVRITPDTPSDLRPGGKLIRKVPTDTIAR